MTTPHPLDRPAWSALNSRQAPLGLGGDLARRFDPAFGPFAGARDASPESLAALAGLATGEAGIAIVESQPWPTPPGLMVVNRAELNQMIAGDLPPAPRSPLPVIDLTEADAPQMRALAELTKPGPFSTRTHQLGAFIGVKVDGRLAAMAGERMQPKGFCEVSGVCTHPDHRGLGLAGVLTAIVAHRIVARGETPFLHVYPDNVGAIRVYEALGFRLRRTVRLTVLERA
jgi:predicted GNAT family acetyltransferase